MSKGRLLNNKVSSVLILLLILSFLGSVYSPAQSADTATYYFSPLKSSINPVTAEYVERIVTKAENDRVDGLIIRLDTPGGLMKSMKKITDRITNAGVPVIVWVGPAGARATSAGVFITYSAHFSAMSVGTNIGAAHPVQGGQQGEMGETMKEKVTNDAVAQLTGLARKRDRNETMASRFIRNSVSINAKEAVDSGVVDFLANNRSELIQILAGRTVSVENGQTITMPASPAVTDLSMSWKEDFLNTIVNPNLVYILMMLGIYGLIYEFSNPGVGLGLVVGGICLLMGMFGMSMLPISYTGLGLVILGIALMILDIFVPTFGVLTMGGLVSFVLGSIMLFETEAFSVSYGLIGGVSFATVTFMLIVGYLIAGSFNKPVAIGEDSILGREGTVKETLNPEGMVYVRGEYWNAKSDDGSTIETGNPVEVVGKRKRTLTVAGSSDSKPT